MQDAQTPELEARVNELSQERDHFRKLYLEALERCVLLERGIMAGNKAERFTADGSQLTLGVLGLLLTPEVPEAQEPPAASPAASSGSCGRSSSASAWSGTTRPSSPTSRRC